MTRLHKLSLLLIFILAITLLVIGLYFLNINKPTTDIDQPSGIEETGAIEQPQLVPDNTLLIVEESESKEKIIEPIQEFKQRITKKPFGIYITPDTSPIPPDIFTGYHAGVDVEFTDTVEEIDVVAIADGNVVYSGWVSGYSGMIIIHHTINGTSYNVLYGHLNPDSLVKANEEVVQGQKIAILGEGETNETDGERKHLHFSVYNSSDIELRGYVGSEAELDAWIDPLTLY